MIFILFLSCLGNAPLRRLNRATVKRDIQTLESILSHSPHHYLRRAAIEEIAAFPFPQWKDTTKDVLFLCVQSEKEACDIRARCGYLLGYNGIVDADQIIIQAIESCDAENRYQLILGLENISSSTLVKAQMVELQKDSDLLIRYLAKDLEQR